MLQMSSAIAIDAFYLAIGLILLLQFTRDFAVRVLALSQIMLQKHAPFAPFIKRHSKTDGEHATSNNINNLHTSNIGTNPAFSIQRCTYADP